MMKFTIFSLALLISTPTLSQALSVTHSFSDGTIARAEQVNKNFSDVVNGVNAIVYVEEALVPGHVAVGFKALNAARSSNYLNGDEKTGAYLTAFGYNALSANTTGYRNVANGNGAMQNNTSGKDNVAVGQSALKYGVSGNDNTALGALALINNNGNENTAVGRAAQFSNETGENNTSVGFQALASNVTGSENVALGSEASRFQTSGDYNTAVGESALALNASGSRNTAVGALALGVSYGDNNTAVGYGAMFIGDGISNSTMIGHNARVESSNTIRLGDDYITAIEGAVAFTSSSDERLKEDIKSIDAGLAFIKDLHPVSYHRINNSDPDIEMGLLAQEVEVALAAHSLSNSGMVHQASEDALRTLRYNDLLAPMIRAIQELDTQHAAGATKQDEQTALLESQLIDLSKQLRLQQEELLAMVQSQQERIARLESMLERTLVAR